MIVALVALVAAAMLGGCDTVPPPEAHPPHLHDPLAPRTPNVLTDPNAWLARYAVPVRSLDAADTDYTDLQPLEGRFLTTGYAYAFLDFRHPPEGGDWLRRVDTKSRLIGGGQLNADWTLAFDGVFYVREQTAGTPLP